AKGAKCLLGGELPDGRGAFYPPTVLTNVRKGMPAYDEELFGPVAAVIPVKNEDEAIATANDSSFGLGGAIITRDLARGERIAAELIDSGCVFVNEAVRSDARLPFGGIKESGDGRDVVVIDCAITVGIAGNSGGHERHEASRAIDRWLIGRGDVVENRHVGPGGDEVHRTRAQGDHGIGRRDAAWVLIVEDHVVE